MADIIFFEVSDWEREPLKKARIKGRKVIVTDKLNERNISKAKDAAVISVFINSHIGKKELEKMPKLKLISTRSTGFDHIDLEECSKRGILVANVPFYGENTVAEHAFALILALSRKVHKAYLKVMEGDFSLDGLRGFDLKGRTLGVVGVGHIGLHTIRIGRGFGMNVLAFDLHRDEFMSEVLGFSYTDLNYLLGNSDIVSLHLPYNKHTHHIINRRNIRKFKRGALLINTARGGLVDTGALLYGLEKGILGGAGLDVLEEEALVKEESQLLVKDEPTEKIKTLLRDQIILKMGNVVYTPHNAFNSEEALQRILSTTLDNISSFMHSTPVNIVNNK